MRFTRLVHADWSVDRRKRFAARAVWSGGRWLVSAPAPVGDGFLDELLAAPVLAGFDFPIGLPDAYGRRTGFADFRAALAAFGEGAWADVFTVADRVAEVGLHRPFYPARATAGVRQAPFLAAHGVAALDELHRRCERATARRRAAAALFWTLGGNQVGKAAIAGWREVIRPALARGAKLWPFDGPLASLSGTVLAECYPGEIYDHLGCRFQGGDSKRRQDDRRARAAPLLDWAARHDVVFELPARAAVLAGFGPAPTGEDAFDALIGLLGLIEVAAGHRPPGPEEDPVIRRFEGWILGQAYSSLR
ncbi:DUF429 domain-containing protein [Zavarzinia compransoris]|uniref:DUF429 domain-containing protein n=1 Tax=Zavarzinia compransoris TaxID=1264899 RepID=A0A317ECU8_9PROT|nr:DUF429 domain-containing protein [Zavarzinia compransoris]PWR23045.1 DUF429 domain-containing protein [Zavarzinia compransoris]TDP46410.1 hypothetical protein DES42_104499 [Zavarzinia compransoris]